MKKIRNWVHYIMLLAQMLFYIAGSVVLALSGHPVLGWVMTLMLIADTALKTAIYIVEGMNGTDMDDMYDDLLNSATVTVSDDENEA